jgi:Ni/Fe-hydrogenase 1 B-type cytochrome subunit
LSTTASAEASAPKGAAAAQADEELVRVYVWEIPVRVAHWVIVASILILSVTGLYIGHPFMTVAGEARRSFVMGWMKVIHGYTAYAFTAAVIARLIWMFTGNRYARWDKFVPVHRARQRGMIPTILFYSFIKDKPPGYVGHNPLAGAAYVLVYGLCLIQIMTGLMLRGVDAPAGSLLHGFVSLAPLIGGLYIARWIHHIVMWLLLGFMLHHIYSSVLMGHVEKAGIMDSIFTGWKWVPRRELGSGKYRWLNRRGELDE